MGLIFRKTVRTGRRGQLNISKSGVSETVRLGPVALNSRGHARIRLGKGVSWRLF